MKIGVPFILKKSKRSSSKKQFRIMKFMACLYAIMWLCALVYVWYYWETAIYYKIGATLILIIVTPTYRDLIISYEEYLKEMKDLTGEEK